MSTTFPRAAAPAPPPAADVRVEATRAHRSRQFVNTLLDLGIYIALAGVFIYFSIAAPYFLSLKNLANIAEAVSVIGIVAAGLTVVLICAQLDLSVGAVASATTAVVAITVTDFGWPILASIALAFLIGAGISQINGFVINKLGVNSIVTTLATSTVIFGAVLVALSGESRFFIAPEFTGFIQGRPGGIPNTFIIMAVIYIAIFVMLRYTPLGWHIYAMGGNQSAAARAGIRVNALTQGVFLLCSTCAVIGGLIIAGQNQSGFGGYGADLATQVLTAVLLGGIGLAGGSGRVERTLAGVVLVGVVQNGLVLMNVQSYFQQMITGAIFFIAVVFEGVRRMRVSR